MGRLFVVELEGKIYSCKHCRTHLALVEDIVSKSFHCRHGKAYLFNKVVNVSVGEKEERMMMTGLHTVADIFCVGCGSIVGWKYETAFEKARSTKKESLFLNGTRFQVLMEAIIGSVMKHMLVEVMQMMPNNLQSAIDNCKSSNP